MDIIKAKQELDNLCDKITILRNVPDRAPGFAPRPANEGKIEEA